MEGKSNVIVVGAGIAGLVAAYELKKKGVSVTVLESNSRVGGRLATINIDGLNVDQGAQFLSSSYSSLIPLIKELGLGNYLVEVSPCNGLVRNGKVHRIQPDNPFTLLTEGVLSWGEWLRFVWNGMKSMWSIRGCKNGEYSSWHMFDDQDAAEWIEARFGNQAKDSLFEPFFQGLYFQPLEGMSRAFVLAIIALSRSKPKTMVLKGGMKLLAEALEMKLRPEIVLNAPVRNIHISDQRVSIGTAEQTFDAEYVILATPAPIAKIIHVDADDLEEQLMRTEYSSSILVSVVVKDMNWREGSSLSEVYGLFIPRTEREIIASIAVESSKHPGWEGQGEILNVMLSGEKSLEMMDQSDKQIVACVFHELVKYFPGLSRSSYTVLVRRWKTAMPTSLVGRSKLVDQYRERKKIRRMILAGDYMGMPYTDSAAETGLWASTQIINNLVSGSEFELPRRLSSPPSGHNAL